MHLTMMHMRAPRQMWQYFMPRLETLALSKMLLGTPFDTAAAAAGPASAGALSGGSTRLTTSQSLALEHAGPITAQRLARVRAEEVRDAEGRQRFHGAFTGGFSAGYFNTVGSKEGWKPTAFVSSRAAKAGSGADSGTARTFSDRVQEIMDEEDQQSLTTLAASESYDAMGGVATRRGEDVVRAAEQLGTPSTSLLSIPMELVVSTSTPIGRALLQSSGWREGHALGGGNAFATAAAAASDREQPAALIESLWKASSNLASGGQHYGIGFTPSRLTMSSEGEEGGTMRAGEHSSAAAAADWRLRITGASGGGGGRSAGQNTLTMGSFTKPGAAAAAATSSSATASGLLLLRDGAAAKKPPGVAAATARLSFAGGRIGFDDDGDDDIAYDDDYAAAGSRGALTGLQPRRALAGAPAHTAAPLLLADDDSRSHAHSSGSSSSSVAPRSTHSSISGSNILSSGASLEAASSTAAHNKRRHTADGRSALPGFHIAREVERSFLEYAKAHSLPDVPKGWRPVHVFSSDTANIASSSGAGASSARSNTPSYTSVPLHSSSSSSSFSPSFSRDGPTASGPLVQSSVRTHGFDADRGPPPLFASRGAPAGSATVAHASSSGAADSVVSAARAASIRAAAAAAVASARSEGAAAAAASASHSLTSVAGRHPAPESVSLAASMSAVGDRFARGSTEGGPVPAGAGTAAAAAAAAAAGGLTDPRTLSTPMEGGAVLSAAPSSASSAAPPPSRVPSAASVAASAWLRDGQARRNVVDWAPARLLCKRMNVPDPLSQDQRRRLEAAAAPPVASQHAASAAAANASAFGAGGNSASYHGAASHSHVSGPSATAQFASGDSRDPFVASAAAAPAVNAPSSSSLLRPFVQSRPPPEVFERIFG